jgi:hypothetical protein
MSVPVLRHGRLVPAIHVLITALLKSVGARDKPGHDETPGFAGLDRAFTVAIC